jgi:hypothetical protein
MEKKWYLAELLQEFHIDGEDTEVLWVNWILVHAGDAEEAYAKALKFGSELNDEYHNTDGVLVTVTFRGLRNLNEIYEELADGSEIIFEKFEDISRVDIERMAKAKEKLAVFQPSPGIDIDSTNK